MPDCFLYIIQAQTRQFKPRFDKKTASIDKGAAVCTSEGLFSKGVPFENCP